MNDYVHRAGVNDDDKVPATADPVGALINSEPEPAEWANDPHGHAPYLGSKNGDQIRETHTDLTKPLGVDVAGAIMEPVRNVSDLARKRIQQVMTRCHQLEKLIEQHEKQVEAELLDRDQKSRAVLTRYGELGALVDAECARTDKALDAISEAFEPDRRTKG